MSAHNKDKRTKEQILKLLDKAITQEEMLSERIKSLESQLTDCRKKAENPRQELTEGALSSSKVSFRIDYYRTAEKGPLKGIIEHLPSRQNKSFEGEGVDAISTFIYRFLNEETSASVKKKTNADNEKANPAPQNKKLTASQQKIPQKAADRQVAKTVNIAEVTVDAKASSEFGSRLLRRLKSELAEEHQNILESVTVQENRAPDPTISEERPKIPQRVKRLLALTETDTNVTLERADSRQGNEAMAEAGASKRTSLLDRLRSEFLESGNQL